MAVLITHERYGLPTFFSRFGCPFDFVSPGLWRTYSIIGSAGLIVRFNLLEPFTINITQ